MKLYELAYACRLYAVLAGFDSSLQEFRRITSPSLDLWNPVHRKALLVWLNSWGCRQFAKEYHSMASKELLNWGRRHLHGLPPETARLAELSEKTLTMAADAYGDLKERSASVRSRGRGSWTVTFGPTGAAKGLYALRPNVFPPWDDPIRETLGYDGSASSYREFLIKVQEELRGLEKEAADLGIETDKIPAAVGRPGSSLPKLVDEYHWVTITKGFAVPTPEELQRWAKWSGRS